MAEERSGFLDRWARRKSEALQGRALDEPAVADKAKSAPGTGVGAGAALPGAVMGAGAVRTPGASIGTASALPAGQAAPASTFGSASATASASVPAMASAPRADAAAPPPEKILSLEDVKALTQDSDFKPFMAQGVGPQVRNAAMKKLFADPHYNVMDGLDIYIDDYSIADPLPQAMLRQMASAKFLNLFEDEKNEDDGKDGPPDNNRRAQEPHSAAASADPAPAPADSPNKPGAKTVAQSAEPSAPESPHSPSLFPADPYRQPEPEPVMCSGASQDDHAYSHLRLQPDHAPPAPSAGRGTS